MKVENKTWKVDVSFPLLIHHFGISNTGFDTFFRATNKIIDVSLDFGQLVFIHKQSDYMLHFLFSGWK